MSDPITPETFAGHVDEIFAVHADGEAMDLVLSEIETHGEPPGEGLRQPFTLIFKGPKNRVLTEGVFAVENAAVGRYELYLIPILSPGELQDYQCVFN